MKLPPLRLSGASRALNRPLLILLLLVSPFRVPAQNGTWTSLSSGNWSEPAKWQNKIIANGATSTADFTTLNIPGGGVTVTLDSDRTIGVVQFRDTSGYDAWVLSGDSTLTMDNGLNIPKVRATGQRHYIHVSLAGTNGIACPDQAGTNVLGGSNTYSGQTAIYRGTLTIANTNALPFGHRTGDVVMYQGGNPGDFAKLDLDAFSITINGLSSAVSNTSSAAKQTITSFSAAAGTSTLTLGDNNAGGAFAGSIQDGPVRTLALKKIGAGTQILSGQNNYSGGTTIAGGTLVINGTNSGAGTMQVHSGAILCGTGLISGPVTVTFGGNISPGQTVGSLRLDGRLGFTGGGTYIWDLAANSTANPGTNYDQLVLTAGNLKLEGARILIRFTGAATLPDPSDPFWQSPRSWKILRMNGAANPARDTFSLIENAITPDGWFSTALDASGGIDLLFTPGATVTNHVDWATTTARSFPSGVRGHCPYRTASDSAVASMFTMSQPSLMRGIAGGLDADAYDWRVRHSGSKWGTPPSSSLITTLDFLRKCRDGGSEPLLSANLFAGGYTNGFGTWVCEFDNHTNLFNPGGNGTTPIPGTAAQLAADWVRYCNVVLQNYRQNQEDLLGNDPNFSVAENAENLRVYNSLKLGGDWGGRDVLLTAAEPAVPRVTWWEVGNEPEVDLGADSTLVTQHGIPDKTVFRDRYKTIAYAMKAVDNTIRTGPCLTTALNGNEWLGRVAEDATAPLDFVSIHPYMWMLKWSYPNPTNMTPALLDIRRFLAEHLTSTFTTLSNYGGLTRSGSLPTGWHTNLPIIASEYNPVNWDAPGALKASMSSALATLEHCFHFAHPNSPHAALPSWRGANYWENPAGVPSLVNAFYALRDYAGDMIVENASAGPVPVADFAPAGWPIRMHITRQTNGANQIHLWGLSFSEDQDFTVHFSFTHLPFKVGQIIQRTYGKVGGSGSLTNSTSLAWTTEDRSASLAPSSFTFTMDNAAFTILTLEEASPTKGPPRFNSIQESGDTLLVAGTNGIVDVAYAIVASSQLATPVSEWTPILTNRFGPGGIFEAAIPLDPSPRRFYKVEVVE